MRDDIDVVVLDRGRQWGTTHARTIGSGVVILDAGRQWGGMLLRSSDTGVTVLDRPLDVEVIPAPPRLHPAIDLYPAVDLYPY